VNLSGNCQAFNLVWAECPDVQLAKTAKCDHLSSAPSNDRYLMRFDNDRGSARFVRHLFSAAMC
jgi:hypothetical protein